MGGYAGPFVGPFPGAWVAYSEDRFGTGIEVYREAPPSSPGPAAANRGWARRQRR